MGTKNNPSKFDCYEKAEPDEPMFVLLGRDPTAWAVVASWVQIRRMLGDTDEEKLAEAMACADKMRRWAIDHGKGEQVAAFDAFAALLPT